MIFVLLGILLGIECFGECCSVGFRAVHKKKVQPHQHTLMSSDVHRSKTQLTYPDCVTCAVQNYEV